MKPRAALALALSFAAACSQSPVQDGAEGDLSKQHPPTIDRPGQPHLPRRNASGQTMLYFGGEVIPNAKVYVVWWGDPSKLNPAITAAKGGIADFYAGITNSPFFDWLAEYNTTLPAQAGSHKGSAGTGQRIGRGNYAGTLTLANAPAGNSITDAQIQSALGAAITAGTLPPPDENAIFAVYFPSAVTISLPDGSRSCSSFGAYHEALTGAGRHNAYYLVMPDCGDSFSYTTLVSSHELIEAVTDGQPTPGSNPDYPQAWNDSGGSETGDLCESSSGTVATPLGTFTVQGIWDEKSQGCKTFRSDAQDFNLALSPNAAAIAPGASATFAVQTKLVAGAAQTLALSVTAPAGYTTSLSSASVAAGQGVTLTVTAPAGLVASAAQVVVRADNASGTTHTAALLATGAAATQSDFSVSVSPSTLTAAPGTSATLNVTTAVTSGAAQAVALSVAGLPGGVTASFSPASVTAGGSSTLTLTLASSAAAGTSALTVTGAGSSGSRSAQTSLTVKPASTGGAIVNGTFEAGTLSGWTAAGTTAAASGSAHNGAFAARTGAGTPTSGDSTLAQTFTTPAGATQLMLWTKIACPDAVTRDWVTVKLKDNVANTTKTVLAKTCSNTGAWRQLTATVKPGRSYTLTLLSHDDNKSGKATSALWDDVAVQ
jgi:hypothetical protein